MGKKASENFKVYQNENGPKISTVSRSVIEEDGKYFKDIDGSGKVSEVNDWRLPARKRAEAYVKTLSVKEKIAQLFISDWRMGKYPHVAAEKNEDGTGGPVLDESGTLDEAEFHGKTIFGEQHLPGTSTLIKEWFSRHLILRANPPAEDLTDFLNQLQKVAEECEHFIPVEMVSNSRNENGEVVYGMNDTAGVFPTWPGTLGIAAAIKGDDMKIADQFAECVRDCWNASGLRKGYMYMADTMTDPRWQRTFGTFGEDTKLIGEIFEHIIPIIQGSKDGVTDDGVAMTVKHFPGGGARENGFDPLTEEKLAGKKVYAEAFGKDKESAKEATNALREALPAEILTGDPAEADYAVLMVSPSSGAYFSATPGFLELDICDGKVVHDVDEAGFNTYQPALLDVIFGRFAPTGKLPFTLPKNDDVLKVDENGVCISPNDVPGYDKDKYMPDEMKDENGKAYAYRDAAGNYYEMDFGLRYDE